MPQTAPDPDRLLSLVGQLYETALEPSSTPDALRNLAGCLNGGAAQIYTWHQATGQVIDSQVSEELAPKDNEAFVAYYSKIDPRRAELMKKPAGTVVRCHELFDDRFVARNEYYQDFFIPAGLRWCIGVQIDGGDGTSTLVANFRPVGAPAYEEWTAATLRGLVPHIRRAAWLRSRLERSANGSMDADAILRALPVGALLVDPSGRLLASNEASGEPLRDLEARFTRRELCFAQPQSEACWREACRGVAASGLARTVELQGSALGDWKAHVLPCGALSSTPDGAERRLLLVVFELLARFPHSRLAALRARYRLTSAETEVLALLLKGMAPKHIAARRGASVATVRSQMSALFGKTACRTQRELIAMVGSL